MPRGNDGDKPSLETKVCVCVCVTQSVDRDIILYFYAAMMLISIVYIFERRNENVFMLKSRGASETVNYSESDQQPDACERISLSPNNKFGGPGLSDENGDILSDFSKLGCCQKITTLLTSSHQFNNLQVRSFVLFYFFYLFIFFFPELLFLTFLAATAVEDQP